MSEYELKTRTLIVSGITSLSVLFGSIAGQGVPPGTPPDVISFPALAKYVSGNLAVDPSTSAPVAGASTWDSGLGAQAIVGTTAAHAAGIGAGISFQATSPDGNPRSYAAIRGNVDQAGHYIGTLSFLLHTDTGTAVEFGKLSPQLGLEAYGYVMRSPTSGFAYTLPMNWSYTYGSTQNVGVPSGGWQLLASPIGPGNIYQETFQVTADWTQTISVNHFSNGGVPFGDDNVRTIRSNVFNLVTTNQLRTDNTPCTVTFTGSNITGIAVTSPPGQTYAINAGNVYVSLYDTTTGYSTSTTANTDGSGHITSFNGLPIAGFTGPASNVYCVAAPPSGIAAGAAVKMDGGPSINLIRQSYTQYPAVGSFLGAIGWQGPTGTGTTVGPQKVYAQLGLTVLSADPVARDAYLYLTVGGAQGFVFRASSTYFAIDLAAQSSIAGAGALQVAGGGYFAKDISTAGNLNLPAGGYVDWGSGDVRATNSVANVLSFTGASSGYLFDAQLVATSLQASVSGSAPSASTYRSDAHGAGAVIGTQNFFGRNSTPAVTEFARISATADGVTAGAEVSSMHFQTRVAGTLADRGYFAGGFVIGSPSGGDQGVGTLNAVTLFNNGTALGQALTRTNDTNVTLTLGGSPSAALVNVASLTLGWTGSLATSRGGTGTGTPGLAALSNITGFSINGTTGTTNSNLVFSNGPSLTGPTIAGGTATALTSLGIRSTGAAFDLTIASTEVFTAGRTLTVTLNDAARTINLSGNLTLAGATSLPAIAQGDLWYGSAAGVISALAKSASASQFLSNKGGSNNPSWAQPAFSDLSGAATMAQMGSTTYGAQATFRLAAVNFNSANTDFSIPITLPTGFTRYQVTTVHLSNASASLTTATIGLFTAAGGGGVAIVANGAITVSSASENTNNNSQQLTTIAQATTSFNVATLFARVGTAQGSAATGDVTVAVRFLS